jgi:hypothetical protein
MQLALRLDQRQATWPGVDHSGHQAASTSPRPAGKNGDIIPASFGRIRVSVVSRRERRAMLTSNLFEYILLIVDHIPLAPKMQLSESR